MEYDEKLVEEIRSKVAFVLKHLGSAKYNCLSAGQTDHDYVDDQIHIWSSGNLQEPNCLFWVCIRRKKSSWIFFSKIEEVFVFGQHEDYVIRYNHGIWVKYIDVLFDRAKSMCLEVGVGKKNEMDEDFLPIDDSDVFSELK